MRLLPALVPMKWCAALLGALVLATVASLSCGGDSGPAAGDLPDHVRQAMAETDYRVQISGPFGDGTVMVVEAEHVPPDRWRIRQKGYCPADRDEQIIIGEAAYRRPCDEEEWWFHELEPQEVLAATRLFGWPLAFLAAVREPETQVRTEPDGTEVIVLTGDLDCEAFVEIVVPEEQRTEEPECPLPPDLSLSVEARIRAEDFALLEVDSPAGRQRVTYRYSDYGEVAPIVEPSPVLPTATPPSGPLPTPPAPPATPQIGP